MQENNKKKFIFAIFLIALALSLFWYKDKMLLGGGESGLPFYNLKRHFEITKYSWAQPALGNFIGIGIFSAKPTFWLLSQFQYLGVPSYLIQAFVFFLLFFISGISVFFLIKEFFSDLGEKYVFLGVLFYWFNPISLVNVWNRFLYNYMFFWALLPTAFFLFIRGLFKKDISFAVLTALTIVIFSFSLTSIPFNILLISLLLFTTLFYLITDKSSDKLFYFKYLFLTLFFYFLTNFWWISQLFLFISTPVKEKVVSEFFSSSGNLETLTVLSKNLGNFKDLLRLMHASFYSVNGLSWAKIYNIFPLSFLGFVIPILIFWIIYKKRKEKKVLFLGVFYFLTLFLMKGNNPPFGEIFEFLFKKITVLQVFRNPFEKFGFWLPLFSAPLFALGVAEFSRIIERENLRKIFIAGVYFYTLIFLGFPFWTGLVFTRQDPETKKLETYQVKVPDYYEKANDWLNNQAGDFRFISLPLGGEGMTYTWEKPYSGVELSSALFDTANISFNTSIPFYKNIVDEIAKIQMTKDFFNFFPFTNSKYLILRKDVNYQERKLLNPHKLEIKLDDYLKEGLITKRENFGELNIYEVNNKFYLPKIYSTKNILVSNKNLNSGIFPFLKGFPTQKFALINTNDIKNFENYYNKLVLFPDYFLTFKGYKKLRDEDLLARLFYVKHLPGSVVYPLVLLKEKIETLMKPNFQSRVEYQVGLLGKRAVEIYKLKHLNASKSFLEQRENDYVKKLLSIEPLLNSTTINSYVFDTLINQFILLKRINAQIALSKLSNILYSLKLKPRYDLSFENGIYLVYGFDIPFEGKYKFEEQENLRLDKFYLNGQLVNFDGVLDLENKEYEIGIPFDDSFKKVILSSKNFEISNKILPSFNLEIADTPKIYRLEFDYLFVKGKSFYIKFIQDIDSKDSPLFGLQVNRGQYYHSWVHFERDFTTTPGATSAVLQFLPNFSLKCQKVFFIKEKCLKEENNFGAEIRNFKVSEINYPEIKLYNFAKDFQKKSSNISYQKINPTKYLLTIEKDDNEPELIVFSELFNSFWKLKINNKESLSDDKHFLVNSFANAWLIDKQGKYSALIEFEPQKFLNISEKVTLASIFTGMFVLAILKLKGSKNENF